MATEYPAYVTDGHHIYVWNEEYAILLEQGKLKASSPPTPRATKKLSARERTKLEDARKKALKDAQDAVELLKVPVAPAELPKETKTAVSQAKLEDAFGSPPKDE